MRNALAALVLAMKCEQGAAQVVVLEEELVTSKSLWIGLMMIIILFLLAVGCWCGWTAHEVVVKWVAQREPTLPALEGHVHAHLDAEAQTIELGLNPELALRGPITAKLTQRCQRCGSPIHLGDWIREFHVGWCHEKCGYAPVQAIGWLHPETWRGARALRGGARGD